MKTKKSRKARVVAWGAEAPLIRHLERAGRLTPMELATMQSMSRAMDFIREAYVSLTTVIGESHGLPADRAWRIMPGGEIGLEDK